MSEPPKSALKTIQAGRLKGKSDINPQWRYKVMTDNFGICGIGWKFNIDKTWLEQGANNEVAAFAQVSVYVRDPETKEWSDAIVGIGGSMFVTNERNGLYTSDEAFKMAVTDAFSTSLKMLGVAAAVYEGRWDGSKYSRAEPATKTSTSVPSSPAPTQVDDPEVTNAIQTVQSYLDSGKITKGIDKVKNYIDTKDLDGLNRVISYQKEQENISNAFDKGLNK